MEAPSVNGSVAQMPTFSTVKFTNASAVINGVTGGINSPSWHSTALNLVSNGIPVDTTSVLGSSGGSFAVSSNSGVSAGVQTPSGIQTAQAEVGRDNPQVIVVGRQSSPPSALQLVVTGQPASASVGTAFALTVDVEDGEGDLVTAYDGAVTLNLVGGPGGASLEGTLTLDAVIGVATFSGLVPSAAGTYTIEIQGSGLLSTSVTFSVDAPPDEATQWVVSVPPPGNVAAGSSFVFQVMAQDSNGNLVSPFNNGPASVFLSTSNAPSPNGTLLCTAMVQNGLATFSGLTVNFAGTYTLWVTGGGLAPTSLSGFIVAPAQPSPKPTPVIIIGEQAIFQYKLNKKGRHVRKPVPVGYTFEFSSPLNPSGAANPANYQVDAATTKGPKKKGAPILHPLFGFGVSYNAASESVTLTLAGKPNFPSGGQITVLAGVTGGSRRVLTGNTVFRIAPKGEAIIPS